MGSVPKPVFLQIRGLDNELEIARCSTEESGFFVHSAEKLRVFVTVQWREAKHVPTLLSILSEIPRAARPHDLEVLKRDDGKYTLVPTALRTKSWYLNRGAGPTFYELARGGRISIIGDYLEYGSNIIRQYQPDFDYSESEEQAYLLLHTLERINKVRESVEDLQNYLWYSKPNKNKAVPPVKDPQRDVRAAVLQDVFGLSTLRIGEMLKFDTPANPHIKRENRTVAAAARRGRELLNYYFGAEEWRQKAKRIRAYRALWFELDDQPKKQIYYLLAERHRTSLEEEETAAMQDGFDRLLEEWIAARLHGDEQAALSLLDTDPRFEEFIRQL
jgi:hypothetical protein